jgi:hypothetical protein
MACRISELVLGCRDPEVLARFWCEGLDFLVLDREEDGTLEFGRAKVRRTTTEDHPQPKGRAGAGKPGCTSTSTSPTSITLPTQRAMNSACPRPASTRSDGSLRP